MSSNDRMKFAPPRRAFLALTVALIGLANASKGMANPDLADLQVVNRETGEVLPTWWRHGRLYVAGEPGDRYALRVVNRTAGRLLVVISVDGVNVLTGETADYGQRGYVLSPWSSYDFDGWRKSLTEVADFAFSPLPQSYAARTGRPEDVGVIGLAVFSERAPPLISEIAPPPRPVAPVPTFDYSPRRAMQARPSAVVPPNIPAPPPLSIKPGEVARAASPAVAGGARAMGQERAAAGDVSGSPPDAKLGTAHGAREWSVTYVVDFERATTYPQCVKSVEYDTFDNLVARGVIPSPSQGSHRPRPFPVQPDQPSFVPDPPPEP